ncbi:MAG: SPOR domain-containing protein [Nitrospirota bacterium]|nr:SPOR domain-containing protein [Nitrospirota bacterium]
MFILSSCRTAPVAVQPDPRCARLVIAPGQANKAPQTGEQPAAPDADEKTAGLPEKVTVVEQKGAAVYSDLGASYSKEGKYKDALQAYKKAAGMIGSDYADIHYNLALTHLALKDRDSALNEYKIIKNIDPVKADKLYKESVLNVVLDKSNKFIVQAGAFRNIKNAYDTVGILKDAHIYAYIKKENDLNKVRVPGIKTKEEAEAIMKEIEKRTGSRPILLNAPQE